MQYSKASKSFAFGDLIVLPPSLFPEVRKLPSTVLNSSAANEDVSDTSLVCNKAD